MNEHSKSPRMGAPKIPPNSVRDFCGIGLWTVMYITGFFATGFADNYLILCWLTVNHPPTDQKVGSSNLLGRTRYH